MINDERLNNINHTLRTIEGDILDRAVVEGDGGNVAHVFTALLNGYHRGLQLGSRNFNDTDGLVVMELMALAKQSLAPNQMMGQFAREAATAAVLRASFMPAPEPEAPSPAGPVNSVSERTGPELVKELLDLHDGDATRLEGAEYPDHWTIGDSRTVTNYLRQLRQEAREAVKSRSHDEDTGSVERAPMTPFMERMAELKAARELEAAHQAADEAGEGHNGLGSDFAAALGLKPAHGPSHVNGIASNAAAIGRRIGEGGLATPDPLGWGSPDPFINRPLPSQPEDENPNGSNELLDRDWDREADTK